MSYPRYPAYKASGVEWLGEVPSHWEVKALKYSFTVVGGSTPKSEVAEYWDGDIAWVTPEDLSNRDDAYVFLSKRTITQDGYDSCGTSLVPADSIVLATRAPIGNVAIAATALCTNQGCKSLVRANDVDSKFYYYVLHIAEPVLQSLGRGSTFLELSGGDLGAFIVPAPPLDEQRAIAAFLDRETAQIDALIAKLEQLIALLQEKRQALISHAVTKGLDPTVPMKDSGVEWLGEVPEHWEVTAIKRLVSTPVTDGPHETPVAVDEGIRFISAEAVRTGCISFDNAWGLISHEDNARFSRKYAPQKGDVYLVKSGATTGRTAIVGDDTDFNIWSPLAALRSGEKLVPEFLLTVLRSRNLQDGISQSWSYGTQQNIGMNVIENLAIPVPPLPEQRAILSTMDSELKAFDALNERYDEAITTLNERRAALITTAVTGSIDVRGRN